jgi:uncharacterized membrane protein
MSDQHAEVRQNGAVESERPSQEGELEMKRWIGIFVRLLFAATMYLIFAELVRHWIVLPTPGNIGFTLVFVTFSVSHCLFREGFRRTLLFFVLTAVISYVMEEVGVRSGLIYGAYHYGAQLGPKLGSVPVLIPLAWFMMIYPSWIVARALLRDVDTSSPVGLVAQAMVAAWVMSAWDTVMDPGMSASGNWVWEHGGGYFGVPLRNYFGWLLTTFLVFLGAGLLWRGKNKAAEVIDTFAALPILIYALYALSYVAPRGIPALQVVALFAMGFPALLAIMQVWARRI